MLQHAVSPPSHVTADLTVCDREPIHLLGSIQPHGVLVAAAAGTMQISHVSENFEASVGLASSQVLGLNLESLLGDSAALAARQSLTNGAYSVTNVLDLTLSIPKHPRRSVLVHTHRGRVIVEFEKPSSPDEGGSTINNVQLLLAGLRRVSTVQQICDHAALELRKLTGYDRVLVYRFDPSGNGTVVAEDKVAGADSYLDLRFPSSDIPVQARRLYLLNRVRSLPDVNYTPVPLITRPDTPGDAVPLDMTYCALRGVSPVHLEYLRNMGVSATLTISLLRDNELWGMIVCHHLSPMFPSANVRALCDVIGQLISVLLIRASETESVAHRLVRDQTINVLRNSIETSVSVVDGLCRQPEALLSLMSADGAAVSFGGITQLIGRTPDEPTAVHMIETLRRAHGESIVGIGNAGETIAERCRDVASGILHMPVLNNPGDGIAWFRPEVAQTVRWGGDPSKALVADAEGRLSPRKSFAAWTQLVMGCSVPWTKADESAAHNLRRTITAALLRQAEVQLAHLSAYDALTGLANRRTLEQNLERWRAEKQQEPAALFFIDIDRFKTINDTLGHAVGDQVLVEIAARLNQAAPAGSVVGRLGGDEFLLFWPHTNVAEAERLGIELANKLAIPLVLSGRLQHASASIGIACAVSDSNEDLMRQADAAMYCSKRAGGGSAVVYEPALHAAVLTNMQTEQDLSHAIENGELEVHYQPLVRVTDRKIRGFEALLRWRHPLRGWISPTDFIPRAEEAGLIVEIGSWVMAQALRQIVIWQAIDEGLTMSINVSSRQLTDGTFSRRLAELLVIENVQPETICVEVTESSLMQDVAVRELHRARALGVQISVDDFGTGYSSLSYLRTLPVTAVKIDKSFMTLLGSDEKSDRFFRAIVNLAHTIELQTVAEGIETEQQWAAVEASGCETVQGWLISKALDATAATNLLKRSFSPGPMPIG